jgi:hypothetical protein
MYNTYISLEFARLQQGELHPNYFVLDSSAWSEMHRYKTYNQKTPDGCFLMQNANANYQHLHFDI